MPNPERLRASNLESHRQPSTDAGQLHASLTTLLIENGDQPDLADAQYCTLPLRGRCVESAIVSNYFTQLVHEAYRSSDAAVSTDETQQQSLNNNNAVIDIDMRSTAYACFRPADIRPDRAYLLGSTIAKLESLPQNQFILLGPEGIVDVDGAEVAQFLADIIDIDASIA